MKPMPKTVQDYIDFILTYNNDGEPFPQYSVVEALPDGYHSEPSTRGVMVSKAVRSLMKTPQRGLHIVKRGRHFVVEAV